jgi:hypothetical protein
MDGRLRKMQANYALGHSIRPRSDRDHSPATSCIRGPWIDVTELAVLVARDDNVKPPWSLGLLYEK